MTVSFYATSNRISPFIAVYDPNSWPTNSGVRRSTRAGKHLLDRRATADEEQMVKASPRFLARSWKTAGPMVFQESRRAGRTFARKLITAIRGTRAREFVADAARRRKAA